MHSSRGHSGIAHNGTGNGGGSPSRRMRIMCLWLGSISLLANVSQAHPPKFDTSRYTTDFGNREDGPGFLDEDEEGGSWFKTIRPPIIDPTEPMESLMERLEIKKRGWKKTDPYYKWVPGDNWDQAAQWTKDKDNEPIYPIMEIPHELRGYRVEEPWRAFHDGPLSPMVGAGSPYVDALTADIDELQNRRRSRFGFLRTRSWQSTGTQTESLWEPEDVPEENILAILHRNHLQGRDQAVHYIPPFIYRPRQQEPGYPRELEPSGRPWLEQADHIFGALPVRQGGGIDDPRNRGLWERRHHHELPRVGDDWESPFAVNTRDRSPQTPRDYDPRRRGPEQRYNFGEMRRVSGRLWESRRTGKFYITPADPRSRQRGTIYDRWLAPSNAAQVWWNFCANTSAARLHQRRTHGQAGDEGSLIRPAAREPVGLGYSGDEEEDPEPPRRPTISYELDEDNDDLDEVEEVPIGYSSGTETEAIDDSGSEGPE